MLTDAGGTDIRATTAMIFKDAPPLPTSTITVTNGTSNVYEAKQNEKVTITANAAPVGKTFDKWTTTPTLSFVDGTTANSEIATFTMPGEQVTIEATYKNIDYTVAK